jgi:type I restriction-modification system DNA methylase subunit
MDNPDKPATQDVEKQNHVSCLYRIIMMKENVPKANNVFLFFQHIQRAALLYGSKLATVLSSNYLTEKIIMGPMYYSLLTFKVLV